MGEKKTKKKKKTTTGGEGGGGGGGGGEEEDGRRSLRGPPSTKTKRSKADQRGVLDEKSLALPTDFFFFALEEALPLRREESQRVRDEEEEEEEDDAFLREEEDGTANGWTDDDGGKMFPSAGAYFCLDYSKNTTDVNDLEMMMTMPNENDAVIKDEDDIEDEWSRMLERHAFDGRKGTSNATNGETNKKKKKKKKKRDRLAPAEAESSDRETTATRQRTQEEFILAVKMHEKFREYVEIMMTCRKLTAQTKRERESLEKRDQEFLAKLDAERESAKNAARLYNVSQPPRLANACVSPTSSSNVTTFTIDQGEERENVDLCRIPDSPFQRDSLERICEDARFQQELNAFMEHSCESARNFQNELLAIYDETNQACETFDAKMKELTLLESANKSAPKTIPLNTTKTSKKRKQGTDEPEKEIIDGKGDNNISDDDDDSFQLSVKSDEAFRKQLLEKYKDDIPALEEEWLNKKPKGKLPKEALIVLKRFWNKKICWPHPREEDKASIKAETTLDATQINNWFINQRKRHWLKMFKCGKSPSCEAESKAKLLEKFGNLDAAIEFCDRNTKSSIDVE